MVKYQGILNFKTKMVDVSVVMPCLNEEKTVGIQVRKNLNNWMKI